MVCTKNLPHNRYSYVQKQAVNPSSSVFSRVFLYIREIDPPFLRPNNLGKTRQNHFFVVGVQKGRLKTRFYGPFFD
jgi:hypothetical protein